MARGGKRQGAGRPKGSGNKRHILDYWEIEDIHEFFQNLKKRYKKSDRLAVWIGDQISGKAVQPIAGDPENPIKVEITGMRIVKEELGTDIQNKEQQADSGS